MKVLKILLVCALCLWGQVVLGDIVRTYSWEFESSTWRWTLRFDERAYRFFKSLPRVDALCLYATNPYDDRFLEGLVNALESAARRAGYGKRKTAEFVVSFVQHLPYTPDRVATGYDEWPKYPLETLIEGGDCEDTSVLMAALLRQMGYDVVLFLLPRHVAVGVW